MIVAIGAFSFLAAFAAVMALVMMWKQVLFQGGSRVQKRLEGLCEVRQTLTAQPAILRVEGLSGIPFLRRGLKQLPLMQRIRDLLDQAGLRMSVSAFIMLIALLGVGGWLIGFKFKESAFLAVVEGVMFAVGPVIFVFRRRKKRIKRFTAQFPDALELLTSALRAGHSFASGLSVIAEEMSSPAGPEFRTTFDEQNYGLSIEEALANLTRRVNTFDVHFFSTAVMIQRETGGNLAEVMEKIATDIRERFKILGQIRAVTAQGRLSGWILGFLPMALGLVILFLNPEYMVVLFTDPVGHYMIGIALALQLIGFLVIRKIVNLKV